MNELFAAFGIDWRLLLLQGINFSILVAGLTYFLYKPILSLLIERQKKIEKGVRDAEHAAQAVKETEVARSSIISEAEKNAEGMLSRAKEEGKREQANIVHAAQERSDALLAEARVQAQELERQALLKSEKEIARVAVLAAEKILKET